VKDEHYRIFIVITVFKRLQSTLRCLESLSKQNYSNFEVVIVDHCETDVETQHAISEKFPGFKVIKGNDAMWWTAATNFGIEYILDHYSIDDDNDLILTLNNDLVVLPNYLWSLIDCYVECKPCIVGSVSVDSNNPEKIDFAGTKWNKLTTRMRSTIDKSVTYSSISERGVIYSDTVPGRGALYPIKLTREIGFYDDQNFPHYASDNDFSILAKNSGYSLVISTKAVVLSDIDDSGLRFDKGNFVKPTWTNFLESQTSIKSPSNYATRYNWARKHTSFPLLYFTIDNLRILFQFVQYFIGYHLSHH